MTSNLFINVLIFTTKTEGIIDSIYKAYRICLLKIAASAVLIVKQLPRLGFSLLTRIPCTVVS